MSKSTGNWRDRAACAGDDPELFFPVSETGLSQTQIWEAKQVCHACPVQWTCHAWAVLHGMDEGIWGGSTASERLAMLGDQAALEQGMASVPRQQDGQGRQRARLRERGTHSLSAAVTSGTATRPLLDHLREQPTASPNSGYGAAGSTRT